MTLKDYFIDCMVNDVTPAEAEQMAYERWIEEEERLLYEVQHESGE